MTEIARCSTASILRRGNRRHHRSLLAPASRPRCAAWNPLGDPAPAGSPSMICSWDLARASDQQAIELRKAAPPSCSRTMPVRQQDGAGQHRRGAHHRLETAEGGGPRHRPRHPQATSASPRSRMPTRPPLRRPAAAGRHRPCHGGPLQGDPVRRAHLGPGSRNGSTRCWA